MSTRIQLRKVAYWKPFVSRKASGKGQSQRAAGAEQRRITWMRREMSIENNVSMPYLPRNIKITCNHKGLTHYGGILFFQEFLRVLQFRHFLALRLKDYRIRHDYPLSQIILGLVYPIVLGLDRLAGAAFLRHDDTFQYLTGLPSYPDPQTLRRFLLKAPSEFREHLHHLNDRLLQQFIHFHAAFALAQGLRDGPIHINHRPG